MMRYVALHKDRLHLTRTEIGMRVIPTTYLSPCVQDASILVQPMHSFPNPYEKWLKSDLAQAALARLDGPAPTTVVKLRVSTPGEAPKTATPEVNPV